MKKILFCLFSFNFFINSYNCEASTYFKSFEILNGTMNMEYDKFSNEYTVYVDEEENYLDFVYELEDEEAAITIIGNDFFTNQNNLVTITIYSNGDKTSYNFLVKKYSDQETMSTLNKEVALEYTKNNFHMESLITMVATLIVIFFFYKLFLRHKV